MHITWCHYLDSDSGGGFRVGIVYNFTGSNTLVPTIEVSDTSISTCDYVCFI